MFERIFLIKDGRTPTLNIRDKDIVLEIGSGHNPHWRSDVLCDKDLSIGKERQKKELKIDRPLILGDGQNLPFKDKYFDYVIARHVVEHVDRPDKFLNELSRVAKAGYIEAPTMFSEGIRRTEHYHKWYILLINNTLIFKRKEINDYGPFWGLTFDKIKQNCIEYNLLKNLYPDLFDIRLEWCDSIKYEIYPQTEFKSFFESPWGEDECKYFIEEQNFSKQFLAFIKNIIYASVHISLIRLRRFFENLLRRRRNKKLNF
jgi:SAM-dependent methyltransferase